MTTHIFTKIARVNTKIIIIYDNYSFIFLTIDAYGWFAYRWNIKFLVEILEEMFFMVFVQIIRDIRRPSSHYVTSGRLRFRFAQVLANALALMIIAGGLAAYFKSKCYFLLELKNVKNHWSKLISTIIRHK